MLETLVIIYAFTGCTLGLVTAYLALHAGASMWESAALCVIMVVFWLPACVLYTLYDMLYSWED